MPVAPMARVKARRFESQVTKDRARDTEPRFLLGRIVEAEPL
jgi:hypothetical protein